MKAYLVGLWLSMSVSLWCVIEVYLDYPGPVSFVFMFIIIVWTLLFNKNKDCKVEMVTTSNELPLCNNVEYCSFFRSSI